MEEARKELEAARKEYADSLQTYRKLAQKSRKLIGLPSRMTLNNLGNLDRDQKRMEAGSAGTMRRRCGPIGELAAVPGDVSALRRARRLNNLGQILIASRTGLRRHGRNMRRRSRPTGNWRRKTRKPIGLYVALTLNNLGILDRGQGRIEEARRDFSEALQIYEALAKQESQRFSPNVARVKKLLAELPSADGP